MSPNNRGEMVSTSEGWDRSTFLASGGMSDTPVLESEQINRTLYTTYLVKPCNGPCSVLALDDWLLIGPVPVLKLGGQVQLNHLQVPVVMIPRVVTIHTDDVHIRRLGGER